MEDIRLPDLSHYLHLLVDFTSNVSTAKSAFYRPPRLRPQETVFNVLLPPPLFPTLPFLPPSQLMALQTYFTQKVKPSYPLCSLNSIIVTPSDISSVWPHSRELAGGPLTAQLHWYTQTLQRSCCPSVVFSASRFLPAPRPSS